jgi:hypothetical protein
VVRARKFVSSNAFFPFAPSNQRTEASNCGGVAVSGLEMAQNSQRLAWTTNEVDNKLKNIMTDCYNVWHHISYLDLSAEPHDLLRSVSALAANGLVNKHRTPNCLPSLLERTWLASSRYNIWHFISLVGADYDYFQVANAMKEHGDWW